MDGQRDGLGQQAAGDQRAEDVVVDVGDAQPHLGDHPVGVFLTGVVAIRVNRRRGLRRRDLGPRVMRRRRRRRSVDEDRQRHHHRAYLLYNQPNQRQ